MKSKRWKRWKRAKSEDNIATSKSTLVQTKSQATQVAAVNKCHLCASEHTKPQ